MVQSVGSIVPDRVLRSVLALVSPHAFEHPLTLPSPPVGERVHYKGALAVLILKALTP
jgi:hypothetical protein